MSPAKSSSWFEVDREGLAALVRRKGLAFVINELVANSFDTGGASNVAVTIERPRGARFTTVKVTDDDPIGFPDMADAFTLFAESRKKGNAELRGRFNLGEKLVLALCSEATLVSTKGTVRFKAAGGRLFEPDVRRRVGTELAAKLPCTLAEHNEMLAACLSIIVPSGITLTLNGQPSGRPASFIAAPEVVLPTEFADAEGQMHQTRRKTVVEVYECLFPGRGWIYELGIPVVETGDDYDYNILQKVPLSMERDNVRPSYLRAVRTAVLDAMAAKLSAEQANQTWVRDAFTQAAPQAVQAVITARFGEKVVSYDPSDPEANNKAVSEGYTVIHGRQLSKEEWVRVRPFMEPAGRVTPSLATIERDPEGKPPLPRAKWPAGAEAVVDYAKALHEFLFDGVGVTVEVHNSAVHAMAWYGNGALGLNLRHLSKRWFSEPDAVAVTQLLIHEFAHRAVSNHLSHEYHDECCRLGALLHVEGPAPQLKA